MSYVSKVLHKKERVICNAGYHWWFLFSGVFIRPLVLVLLGSFVITLGEDMAYLVGLFYFAAIISFTVSFILFYTTERVLTTQRLIVKAGFIFRRTEEIDIKKLEEVNLRQSILGRILRYGTIIVSGTGRGKIKMKYTRRPLEFMKKQNKVRFT